MENQNAGQGMTYPSLEPAEPITVGPDGGAIYPSLEKEESMLGFEEVQLPPPPTSPGMVKMNYPNMPVPPQTLLVRDVIPQITKQVQEAFVVDDLSIVDHFAKIAESSEVISAAEIPRIKGFSDEWKLLKSEEERKDFKRKVVEYLGKLKVMRRKP